MEVGGTLCIFIASSKRVRVRVRVRVTFKSDLETPPPPDSGCSLEITYVKFVVVVTTG